MRAVIQRVKEARVEVEGSVVGSIGRGLLVLLGIAKGDSRSDADWLIEKITNLRIFEDARGKMNLSALDTRAALLVVSQFTLYADTRQGRRPGFDQAARPEDARALYEYFVQCAGATGLEVSTGIFQAEMAVWLCNDGPVTLICDSPARGAQGSESVS